MAVGPGRAGVCDAVGGDDPGIEPGRLGPGHDGGHVVLSVQLGGAVLAGQAVTPLGESQSQDITSPCQGCSRRYLVPRPRPQPDGGAVPLHAAQVGGGAAGAVRHRAARQSGAAENRPALTCLHSRCGPGPRAGTAPRPGWPDLTSTEQARTVGYLLPALQPRPLPRHHPRRRLVRGIAGLLSSNIIK